MVFMMVCWLEEFVFTLTRVFMIIGSLLKQVKVTGCFLPESWLTDPTSYHSQEGTYFGVGNARVSCIPTDEFVR
jgi:hypothetical protein